ncbi:adenylate/guanylate cyclase domain-containing protein [Acuticoccus kandeliae]|uniref:adenylate/guanylate cyclase domain-containing protein n=1 Tax=Acuticoccus kandeliae TaxID=2073160 RepID=UPI00147670B6|nr:adenylate/guanylate cyclase domain-containing protein [Acuticoccus kandeliae]
MAAILAADVAGYSRLMGQDEVGTLRRLTACRAVLDGLIDDHGGRIANTAGDSVLAEFASAVEAMQCAVEAQARMADLAQSEGGDPMRIRIGIHVGDVIVRGEDLLGDGVNVAARLEGIAEPGGICISGVVYDQIRQAIPVPVRRRRRTKLKNIDRDVAVYDVSLPPSGRPADEAAATFRAVNGPKRRRTRLLLPLAVAFLVLAGAGVWLGLGERRLIVFGPQDRVDQSSAKPSLAVLPFANFSDETAQDYFADGITDDLINDLSKVAGLFVVARNSTFTYKNVAVDVREVAENLGVRYVVEGSVRRSEGRVRINIRLIDALSGGQLWADRYEGSTRDLFGLQDDIAGKITSELAVQLSLEEHGQIATRQTEDPAAYDEFLQGWSRYLQQNPAAAREAIGHFERAIALDPDYSRAYAALAATYWQIARRQWQEERFGLRSVHDARLKAEDYLRKAQLSPTSLSHQVAAAILSQQGRHDAAVEQAEAAISMDPNDADAYVALASALNLRGQAEKARDLVLHAMRLNPISPETYYYELGLAQFGLEEFEAAAESFERALATSADDRWSSRALLATYGQLGRTADAERIFALASANRQGLDPLTIRGTAFWYPFEHAADWERMATGLRLANVPD